MKMSILEIEYKNIRKISNLKLSFENPNGNIIGNSFIMMANGTGKTTTMSLIKGVFDGSANGWSSSIVKTYAPTTVSSNNGEFSIKVKFDEKIYHYFLVFDYIAGTARIETAAMPKGRENGRILPESIKTIFTEEFVKRFVFDGEQAEKSMDSKFDEAEQTIKYLYRLDKLDDILSANQKILSEIQNTEGEGRNGSDSALSNLRTRRDEVKHTIRTLKFKADSYKKRIEEYEAEKAEKIAQRNEIDKKYKDLNQEKNNIIKEIEKNKKDISAKIAEIMRLTKSPYLISQSLCDRMRELGASMTKLKLPKNTSKDFFTELAHSEKCVCDRCIGETEREAILRNAERYLGSNQQSVLNTIKSSISGCEYDSSLNDAFEQLSELQEQATILNNRFNDNEEKLIKAGGDKAAELQSRIEELTENIGACKKSLNVIEAKSDPYETLTKDNNLCLANEALDELEKKIAAATNTNRALRRKEIVEELLNRIKQETTKSLKAEIVRKTNEKLKSVITDDKIEIESIDKYIKLKDRAGASEGQTLGIAYCFLGTLFEDAELQFPFIIDSPTGKMDFAKRQAVADIIPNVFNQMIAFVQSAEVERFADRFYSNPDSQYITIIASPDDEAVEVNYGNAYALKGYNLIHDYPLSDKPTSREEFLEAFNAAIQMYSK